MSGVKKSKFTAVSTIDGAAYFDFVVNGTNLRIPVADMIAAFGTVGTLEQLGAVTGVPVLSKVGTVNYIRNILGGSGVVPSVGPLGSVKLDHRFTADEVGVPILINPGAASPTIRSIRGSDGINVSGVSGEIIVALSSAPVSTRTVIVNAMSDFPDPVADVITLEDDTQYFVTNKLSTANEFVMGDNTIIRGSDSQVVSLTYTGTGTMFSSVDSTNELTDITAEALSGTLLDWAGTYGTDKQFLLRNSVVRAKNLGNVAACDGFATFNVNISAITSGLTFSGTCGLLSISDVLGSAAAGVKFLDLDSCVMDGFSFRNAYVITAAGAFILSGLANSANVAAGGLANVINVRLIGDGTFLENIAVTDNLWEFQHNDGAPDSINSLLAVNAGVTVPIAVINTPLIVGATWTFSHLSRFTGTAGGRFTYGGKGAHISINATITATIVISTQNCTFYVYKNGVKEVGSGITRALTAGSPGNLSLLWQVDVETGDYIEIWCENNGSTSDIVVSKAIVSVGG